MDFSNDFPVRPPKCMFKPVLPHPNIYPSGTVCLSILNDEEDWKPNITVKQILLGIQKLLKDEPNIESPAQQEPLNMYKNDKKKYLETARAFASKCRPATKWVKDKKHKKECSTRKKIDLYDTR